MDRLSEMESFVAVVDQGGFTGAARRLGVSKSSISKQIAALEARLAVRLLDRTTRRVSPTEIGLAFYDKVAVVLREAGDAEAMVTAMQDAPRGALRVSAPVTFGARFLAPLVADFLHDYPEVDINLVLEDRFVELIAEGFDMAVRIGNLADSSLRARKLASAGGTLAAAPDYIARHGMPTCIDDLSQHALLHYSNMSTGNAWRLIAPNGEERQVRAGGRLTANSGEALLRAAESGLGIGRFPDFILGDSVRKGRLVEVLPDLPRQELGIYALYPPGRFVQPKLRAFIDYLAERLKNYSKNDWTCA